MMHYNFNNAVAARAEQIEGLAPFGVRMTFAPGEEIYAQEESADLVYRVISGSVRTLRLTCDGRRQIGDFYYPGEVFGLEPGEAHRYSAEALSAATILVIKKSALPLYGEEGVKFERIIADATRRELARTQDHLMVLGRRSACERVASFLLDVADRSRLDIVELTMGRQDMADFLGLTIETVSRMMTQLQADRLIRLEGLRRLRIVSRESLELAAGL